MQYKSLGRTGLQVSAACLGTMTFGADPNDWGCTEEESNKIISKAFALGVNFIDTANVYSRGISETIVGKALKNKRSQIIIATKGHGKMHDTDPNAWGNTRRNIIQACEASLKRLQTDWIDLYQIHRPQPSVPIDETLHALDDLIHQGKIRYAGCSTFAGWQVCEAHYVAKALGLNGFQTEQPPYNLLDRRIERELLPFCKTYDYGVITWSPLAGGQLSGKYLQEMPKEGRYVKNDPQGRFYKQNGGIIQKLKEVADQHNMSLTTLSIAWIASQPGITCPIIGARKLSQLEECVMGCQIHLDEAVLLQIDKIVSPMSYQIDYYSNPFFGPNARPLC